MRLDITGEAVVGLFLLHLEHLGHVAVGVAQLKFPVDYAPVNIHPAAYRLAVVYLHGYVLETLLVSALGYFGHDFLLVDVLLQRKEYLVGVYGLDKIVSYLGADGLVHDVFLLALGNHNHRRGGRYFLNLLQSLKSAEARHHLVKQNQVKGLLPALVYGVGAVGHGHYVIPFLLKKKYMGAEQFHLVVSPQK